MNNLEEILRYKNFLRLRRLELWKHDPRCRCCLKETILPKRNQKYPLPGNLATIQHIYDKKSPFRVNDYFCVTLFCNDCNNKDSQKFYSKQYSENDVMDILKEFLEICKKGPASGGERAAIIQFCHKKFGYDTNKQKKRNKEKRS